MAVVRAQQDWGSAQLVKPTWPAVLHDSALSCPRLPRQQHRHTAAGSAQALPGRDLGTEAPLGAMCSQLQDFRPSELCRRTWRAIYKRHLGYEPIYMLLAGLGFGR